MPPSTRFHGGFGILNREGIRKPSYFAYKYLHQLLPTKLTNADASSIVTRSGNSLVILLWSFNSPEQNSANKTFFTHDVPPTPVAPRPAF